MNLHLNWDFSPLSAYSLLNQPPMTFILSVCLLACCHPPREKRMTMCCCPIDDSQPFRHSTTPFDIVIQIADIIVLYAPFNFLRIIAPNGRSYLPLGFMPLKCSPCSGRVCGDFGCAVLDRRQLSGRIKGHSCDEVEEEEAEWETIGTE